MGDTTKFDNNLEPFFGFAVVVVCTQKKEGNKGLFSPILLRYIIGFLATTICEQLINVE